MVMYMRRIIHQRNSFNNYHRMIGGMEDEERERQQREWDAWRAEEREQWDRQQRKATNRRERDDVNRGYWELTEPLTTDEEYELRNLNDFDKWEEVTTDDKKEWKLKDPDDQQRYGELYKKDQAYKGSFNYAETRAHPREYYERRFWIKTRHRRSRSPVRERTRHRLPLRTNMVPAQLPTPDQRRRTTTKARNPSRLPRNVGVQ